MHGPTPPGTEDFIMQQTMIRVKDPIKSLDFYCNVLGFRLIHYSEVHAAVCTSRASIVSRDYDELPFACT